MATDTRDRILDVTGTLLQRQGFAGTGIKQILTEAGAPFSSLYHFFPGGKDQLGEESIHRSGAVYQQLVEAVFDAAPDLLTGIAECFAGAAATLVATDYADACPIATVALEVASTNEPLRTATADVFTSWIASAAQRYAAAGIDAAPARALAIAMIAALEGAFVLSRALRSTEPMAAAGAAAVTAARAALPAPGATSRKRGRASH